MSATARRQVHYNYHFQIRKQKARDRHSSEPKYHCLLLAPDLFLIVLHLNTDFLRKIFRLILSLLSTLIKRVL